MNVLFRITIFILFLYACSAHNSHAEKETEPAIQNISIQDLEPLAELTPKQAAALDAFNTLQLSTDQMNQLYSTFAGTVHACYPPDTSFTITQAEFLRAMESFVTRHCKNLSPEERDTLSTTSVLAQEEYNLLLCLDQPTHGSYENGAPMTGTWILPNLLGRRDVIIVW